MSDRNLKHQLTFPALILFFGCGLLLTNELIAVHSVWDYVIVHLLTLMNGLGLSIVIMWWITHVRRKKAEALEDFPVKVSRGTAGKCG